MDSKKDVHPKEPGMKNTSSYNPKRSGMISRRQAIGTGTMGLASFAISDPVKTFMNWLASFAAPDTGVFKKDAPVGELWELWKKRGWVKEAYHYLKLGRNVQCKVCPNECLLEPDDRSHCRNKVNKDGALYTMAYGDPCTFHVDPVEKKPLLHFYPGMQTFSIATSGCGFRCLNCQNWEISQKKPEETKDPRGTSIRCTPQQLPFLRQEDIARMSMFPEDVVSMAQYTNCPAIAYTYSEPTCYFEYMYDTAKLARSRRLKNIWVSCGYIQQETLLDLCQYIDAAHIDLKSFSEDIYAKLNTGKLQPILDTIRTLRQKGIWFEVINLVIPTYTDNMSMIRQMCDWLVKYTGPDQPLHFSRFQPLHKLTQLPPTPTETLLRARETARNAGLQFVYIGNAPEIADGETTFCPGCKKAIIERDIFAIRSMNVSSGKCKFCGTKIAGVWQA